MAKRWTEDDLDYLEYCLYNQEDLSLSAMSEHLGRSINAIKQKACKLRRKNKELPRFREFYTERDNNYISNCYRSGIPPKVIAEQLGRSVEAIHAQCVNLGLTNRRLTKRFDKEIRELAKRGYWAAEISRELNIDLTALCRYNKKNNIICAVPDKRITQKKIREINEERFSKYGLARRTQSDKIK